MLISHEVPMALFEESKSFNDYDYCLLHLTYTYPVYRDFYRNATKSGRQVILDNSIFENGVAVSNEQLAKGVLDIRPTWYIIPDCLDNRDVTVQQFEDFKKEYKDIPGQCIGVVQGSTLEELVDCYRFMSEKADKVGISFDSKAYEFLTDSPDKLDQWCRGRQFFVQYLVNAGLWNKTKPHHLLGCSYAREFNFPLYRELSIESCDTSNPVVAGIHGLRYEENGLNVKPSTKLCDLITYEPDEEQRLLIRYNVQQFRRICNG